MCDLKIKRKKKGHPLHVLKQGLCCRGELVRGTRGEPGLLSKTQPVLKAMVGEATVQHSRYDPPNRPQSVAPLTSRGSAWYLGTILKIICPELWRIVS